MDIIDNTKTMPMKGNEHSQQMTGDSYVTINDIITEVVTHNRVLIIGPFTSQEFDARCYYLEGEKRVKYIGFTEGNNYNIVILPYIAFNTKLQKQYLINRVREYLFNKYHDVTEIDEIISYLLTLTFIDGVIKPQNLNHLAQLYYEKGDSWAALAAALACQVYNNALHINYDCDDLVNQMKLNYRKSIGSQNK